MMADEKLAEYVPAYGDRIAVVAQCAFMSEKLKEVEKPELEQGLLQRIKCKMRKRRKKLEEPNPLCGNKNASKLTRRVEIGWMDYDSKVQDYKQVRTRVGGGTRHLKVPKSGNTETLMEAGKNLFFPDGISKRGKIEDFDVSITDYQGRNLGTSTVEEWYELQSLKMLRIYFCTKKKPQPLNDSVKTSEILSASEDLTYLLT